MIRYLKRLSSSTFVCVKAFPMYGGVGVSAPSLVYQLSDYHRKCKLPLLHGEQEPLILRQLTAKSVVTGHIHKLDIII